MKRTYVLVILISSIIALLLSSCSLGGSHMFGRLYNNDQADANVQMDRVLDAIQKKNKNTLKAMFSKKAVVESKDFDKNIDNLFGFYQGDFKSYNDWGAVETQETIDNGHREKELDSTYDVVTSKQIYRFAIQDFTIDTANPDNVGIYSLYIIKMEDDTDKQFAYRGDGKYTPGINFNIKNVLPKEDP